MVRKLPHLQAINFGHLEVEQPQVEDLQSPWLLTTEPSRSWDDPPSNHPKNDGQHPPKLQGSLLLVSCYLPGIRWALSRLF